MSYKFCAAFLSSVLLIACPLLDAAYCRATASGSNGADNSVAEYLDGAKENTHGEDHRQVFKQALNDMLDLPVKKLRDKYYPDYEMRRDSWSITVILERYIVPKRQDLTISDNKFFDDMKKPEAQRVIDEWLVKLSREDLTGSGSTGPRNTVEDYLNGAEEQVETNDQEAVIKQAFADMLYEPVESLRKKRYPDYQLHPHKWPITEVLTSYFLPDSFAGFDDDEFFRDLKKPEAQKVIQRWFDHMNNPDGKNGPAREERP
ncbi:MAG: hypothetical protein WCD12_04850 [Candidatus Binatus sp.]|uniref:hypothetical protein n=1 Tax=Candidatus Binatus sp. TaxID=2811406 RepID=UPI003C75DC48